MNLDLTNRNALVCGSTQGIGKATAIALAHMGANVTLLARNEDKLKSVLADLDTAQGQSHTYACADFSNPNSVIINNGTISREMVNIDISLFKINLIE